MNKRETVQRLFILTTNPPPTLVGNDYRGSSYAIVEDQRLDIVVLTKNCSMYNRSNILRGSYRNEIESKISKAEINTEMRKFAVKKEASSFERKNRAGRLWLVGVLCLKPPQPSLLWV
jgi:hypothetical protein